MTQIETVSFTVGGSVKINCKTSQLVYSRNGNDYIAWYQQKAGELSKPLMLDASKPASGTPSHFTGSGSNYVFTLTVIRVRAEDAAVYLCHSVHSVNRPWPYTQSKIIIQKLSTELSVTTGSHCACACLRTHSHTYHKHVL